MVSDSEGQNLYVSLWGTPNKIHLGLEPAFPDKPVKLIKRQKGKRRLRISCRERRMITY